MALLINLRRLDEDAKRMHGELPVADLELEGVDEIIHVNQPLRYDLDVQKMDDSVLAQGRLELVLNCECARCLKPFEHELNLRRWACHLPLEGEEKVTLVNDCVDLTPYIREDILLEFPQHPLCKPDCGGLAKKPAGRKQNTGPAGQTKDTSSAWAELNKLKL